MDLREQDGPGGRFVTAAARCLVEAEGLECSGEGEEEHSGDDEDADVEMGQAKVFQKSVGRGHGPFLLYERDEIRVIKKTKRAAR